MPGENIPTIPIGECERQTTPSTVPPESYFSIVRDSEWCGFCDEMRDIIREFVDEEFGGGCD